MIQELLQSKNPVLDQTITKCGGLEEAKKTNIHLKHIPSKPSLYQAHALAVEAKSMMDATGIHLCLLYKPNMQMYGH